jgi:hypothetical protein
MLHRHLRDVPVGFRRGEALEGDLASRGCAVVRDHDVDRLGSLCDCDGVGIRKKGVKAREDALPGFLHVGLDPHPLFFDVILVVDLSSADVKGGTYRPIAVAHETPPVPFEYLFPDR